jgi:uncharacterized protein (TIGR03000 family)
MRCINFFRLARRAPGLCALLLSAVSGGEAFAQVAAPFGFFGGRSVYLVDQPASYFGYNLDDPHPGYYGGGNYREYYAFGRGTGIANFPGPVPGPDYYWDWTAPWRHEWVLRPPPPGPAVEVSAEHLPMAALPAEPPPEPVVHFTVEVPAAASVFLEGAQTKQTGTSRQYVSPRLVPGKQYVYEIRARWMENGREVEQTRSMVVKAGDRLTVSFTRPSATEPLPTPRQFPVGVGK